MNNDPHPQQAEPESAKTHLEFVSIIQKSIWKQISFKKHVGFEYSRGSEVGECALRGHEWHAHNSNTLKVTKRIWDLLI